MGLYAVFERVCRVCYDKHACKIFRLSHSPTQRHFTHSRIGFSLNSMLATIGNKVRSECKVCTHFARSESAILIIFIIGSIYKSIDRHKLYEFMRSARRDTDKLYILSFETLELQHARTRTHGHSRTHSMQLRARHKHRTRNHCAHRRKVRYVCVCARDCAQAQARITPHMCSACTALR